MPACPNCKTRLPTDPLPKTCPACGKPLRRKKGAKAADADEASADANAQTLPTIAGDASSDEAETAPPTVVRAALAPDSDPDATVTGEAMHPSVAAAAEEDVDVEARTIAGAQAASHAGVPEDGEPPHHEAATLQGSPSTLVRDDGDERASAAGVHESK
ncbi:MAG: hypothetical protein ACOCX4_07295, partial [Planctomycetota bacterium]